MMRGASCLLATVISLTTFVPTACGADGPTEPSTAGPTKYLLRYQFRPGETIRWQALHQARMEMKLSEDTQVTETVSKSVKVWRVTDVRPDGTAVFENLVEHADMWQKASGREEVRYNSRTDPSPPPEFRAFAESIGIPLAEVTINTKGEVLQRKQNAVGAAAENPGQVTIPLPDEAVPVGHTWSFPYDLDVPLEHGTVKKVKILQTFKLESVKTGVATIQVATKILTPIHDPAVEAKLVKYRSTGTVRFDVDAGRVLRQQMDVDRRVVGFTRKNPASRLHYLTRYTETLLPEEPKLARRPGRD